MSKSKFPKLEKLLDFEKIESFDGFVSLPTTFFDIIEAALPEEVQNNNEKDLNAVKEIEKIIPEITEEIGKFISTEANEVIDTSVMIFPVTEVDGERCISPEDFEIAKEMIKDFPISIFGHAGFRMNKGNYVLTQKDVENLQKFNKYPKKK